MQRNEKIRDSRYKNAESSLYLGINSGFGASVCKNFCLIFNKHYVIFSSINNFNLCTFDIAFSWKLSLNLTIN